MSDFYVDPDRFARSAQQFDGLAEELARTQLRLEYRQLAEGECWGLDEAGSEFAQGYEPGVRHAIGNADTLTDVLARIADTMRSAAAQFDATDQHNTRNMCRIEEEN